MDIDEIRRKRAILSANSQITFDNMDVIINESNRVTDVAHNAKQSMEALDDEFEKITGLDRRDFVFLFFATALQTLRWVLSPRIGEGFDPNTRMAENDTRIKDEVKKSNKQYQQSKNWKNGESSKGYKDWQNIIFSKPPYDTIKGSAKFGLNLSGLNHRYKTLGHDPLLGWVFGTVNIMTDTATMNTFRTFNIKNGEFVSETTIANAFHDFIQSAQEDWHRIPAAVFAEGVHLKSDEFTKIGLPIPILSTFNEDLAKKLCSSHYDKLSLIKDAKTVANQAIFAILINVLISSIHSFYYDENKHGSTDLYEVKIRKIILYSNLIASVSNVLYVAISTYLGDGKAWQKLDIGGIAVTLFRLTTDVDFIFKVKEEFIFGKFNKMIQGDELNLQEVKLWV